MHFTREDFYKIEKWLSLKTVKDSSFSVSDTIDGTEKVPLLQSGSNKLASTDALLKYLGDRILSGAAVVIVQNTGNSTTAVMSQDAVTKALSTKLGSDSIVQSTGSSANKVMSQDAVTKLFSQKLGTDVIVQELGDGEGLVISQKTVTENLNKKTELHTFADIVNDATILEQSSAKAGEVVYVKAKNVFALRVEQSSDSVLSAPPKYYSNWGKADNYLTSDRASILSRNLYLLNNSLYAYVNGSLQLIGSTGSSSTTDITAYIVQQTGDNTDKVMSQSAVTKELSNTLRLRRFSDIKDDVTIEAMSTLLTTSDGEVVYLTTKKIFVLRVSGSGVLSSAVAKYYSNWDGAGDYMDSVRSNILKDNLYLCGKTLYAWIYADSQLEAIGSTSTTTGGDFIVQVTGVNTDKVMSQNAVTTELDKKLNKESLVQETGTDESLIMSQKATTANIEKKAQLCKFTQILTSAVIETTSTISSGDVVYITSLHKFVLKVSQTSGSLGTVPKYYGNWPDADSYMDSSRTDVIQNNLYLMGKTLYAWVETDNALEIVGSMSTTTVSDVIVQNTGSSTGKVMSQKSVTQLFRNMYSTTPFTGIVDSATLQMSSSTDTTGSVVYITSLKVFAWMTGNALTAKYYGNWTTANSTADSYMNTEKTAVLPNKLFEYNDTLYIYDKTSGELVRA